VLLINCPYCGPRAEIEFRNGGEAHIARPSDPAATTDETWTEFLYMRTNPKGAHAERWRHRHGCGRFFNVVRDTVSDKILANYRVGEPRPELPGFGGSDSTRPESGGATRDNGASPAGRS
jgi:sarcosine oxidase, subunit delta